MVILQCSRIRQLLQHYVSVGKLKNLRYKIKFEKKYDYIWTNFLAQNSRGTKLKIVKSYESQQIKAKNFNNHIKYQ